MRMTNWLVAAPFWGLLAACSAEVHVTELQETSAGTEVDGVPFRAKERYLVKVYKKTEGGYAFLTQARHTLPNPNHIYVLHHHSQLLANSDTKVEVQSDGTLNLVGINSSSQGDEALTALSEEVTNTATSLQSLREARDAVREAERDPSAAENATIAYQTAVNAVQNAEAELAGFGDDKTEAERVVKANEIEILKLQANVAARLAGVSSPYPDLAL